MNRPNLNTCFRTVAHSLRSAKDIAWALTWLAGLLLIWLWDLAFLNTPARLNIQTGFLNTLLVALLVILFSTALAWLTTIALEYSGRLSHRGGYLGLSFVINLIRSVPQIVGVLFGYIWLTSLINDGALRHDFSVLTLMALIISLFVFFEMVDLMRERIAYYKQLDFYNAMLVCGIPRWRIINFDILWKNSRIHIFNKMIALFGVAVFLQCSVDFIVSVGLSTEVSAVNLPATLGSLLAKIDSKQDILAIGYSLTNWSYLPNIFFKHLQGVSVAVLIVFSLLSIYKISTSFAERHRL